MTQLSREVDGSVKLPLTVDMLKLRMTFGEEQRCIIKAWAIYETRCETSFYGCHSTGKTHMVSLKNSAKGMTVGGSNAITSRRTVKGNITYRVTTSPLSQFGNLVGERNLQLK